MTRKTLTKNLKMLFAAHHYVFKSNDIEAIADVVNVKPSTIEDYMQSDEWVENITYWKGSPPPKEGDLKLARTVWLQMVTFDEHLFPSEYPDVLFNGGRVFTEPPTESIKNNALEMRQYRPDNLIATPFVVENLSDEQIRDRIAQERDFGYTPMKYEKQRLKGYYWWLYPNWCDADACNGVFSKVFAKANMFGNLVVGAGEKTHLVCIEDDRFVLSQNVSDNAVLVSDERLFVCL